MATVAQGTTQKWVGFTRNGSGQLVDADELTLLVLDPTSAIVAGPVSLPTIVRDGVGMYHYDEAIASNAMLGTYEAIWTGSAGGQPINGTDSVIVVPPGIVSFPSTPGSSYMTVQRFRAASLIDLTGYTDFAIGNFIEDASSEIDSYCNVPLLPLPHSFLGGSVTGEEHRWRFPDSPTSRGQRRVYPKHWPVISVEGLALKVGYGTVAPIPFNTLVVNNAERWVEVTALTIANTSGLFGVSGWIVPMGGLTVPVALLDYTYGWNLPAIDERLRSIDGANTVFQAAHGFWLTTIEVTIDGVTQDLSAYTVDAEEGRVLFGSPVSGVVRASYTHRLPREIARATALVMVHLIQEDKLRKKGLGGLSRLRINEVDVTRQNRLRGDQPADLSLWAPDAALQLAGFRYWVAA